MDQNKVFTIQQLCWIGILSGVTVSVVKLIQLSFRLSEFSTIDIYAALVTYLGYMFLGAMGAVFLVDHDAKGQKMLKNAFLMGFVAPSFFLALLNQPVGTGTNLREMIGRVPKIADLFIASAYAQTKSQEEPELTMGKKIFVLEKSRVEPTFGAALWRAVGGRHTPDSYAYVVGTTNDAQKALQTAVIVNKILREAGHKEHLATVVQPSGQGGYYVTLGDLGTPNDAAKVGEIAKTAAIRGLEGRETEETKRAAALILKGQVVDARAMFVSAK